MTHTTSLPEETRGLDRRSVVKAAAWAAPEIAVAVAAPMAAASGEPTPAPTGSLWENSLNISTSEINRTVGTGASSIKFDYYPNGTDEDPVEAGTYTIGAPTFTLSWTGAGSYALDESGNLRGWTRLGPAPAPGTSGSVSYTYPAGLLNGASTRLPSVVLRPTTDAPPALPATAVTFAITGSMGSLGPASSTQTIN